MDLVCSTQNTGFYSRDLPFSSCYTLRTGTQAAAGRVATGSKFSASLASLVVKETLFLQRVGRIHSANSRPQGRNVLEAAALNNTASMGLALEITQDMEVRMGNDYGLAVLVSGATRPSSFSIFWLLRPAYCAWPSPQCAGRSLRLSPTGRSRWPAQGAHQPAVPGSSPRPERPYSHGWRRSTARPQ